MVNFRKVLNKEIDDPVADQVRRSLTGAIGELQDHAGQLAAAGGRYLGRQTLAGTGTYTPTPGTRRVKIRGAAGGGGGGGAAVSSAGGGGGSGAFIDFEVASQNGKDITGGAFSGGLGGAGGSAAGGNGGTGGDASLLLNGITYLLKGGLGGQGMTAGGGDGAAQGGNTQTGSTAGAVQSPGEPSIRWSAGLAWLPGSGGQTILSAEARAISSGVTAPTGGGFGAGGAGGLGSGATASAGGNGAPGGWFVEEHT
jgi:hypothetical protein